MPRSISNARSRAFRMRVSSSDSSTVVKRIWFAVVWRWMKVWFSGAAIMRSAWVVVVSMK